MFFCGGGVKGEALMDDESEWCVGMAMYEIQG